jgi:hypothetical protein
MLLHRHLDLAPDLAAGVLRRVVSSSGFGSKLTAPVPAATSTSSASDELP